MATQQFEPSRAIEIMFPRYGTGYRIGGRLVLTAAHLLDEVESGCRVRSKQSAETSFETANAKVVWKAQAADVALVELPEEIDSCEAVVVGKLPVARKGETIVFQMYGYPQWARTQRETRTVAGGRQLEGVIYLADTSPDGFLVLEAQRLPPAGALSSSSEWGGASGAAIVCDGLVVGVQSRHQNPNRPASLEAASLAEVYNDQEWCKLLRQHNVNPEPTIVCIGKTSGQTIDWEVCDAVDQIIQRHITRPFVVRSKQQELDDFLEKNSQGLLLLTADAGFGKTALLADWIHRNQQETYFIAYHFFSQQNEPTRSLAKAYQHLLHQLEGYFHIQIGALPDDEGRLRAEIYNLIRENPARADKPLVIILDGLDEADLPFDPLPLPDNVFMIASMRVGATTNETCQKWQAAANRTVSLKEFSDTEIAQWLIQIGDVTLAELAGDYRFVTRLSGVTQGFPLYLQYLIDELSHVTSQKQDVWQILDHTPQGFEQYVNQQLGKLDKLDELDDEQRWQFFTLLTVAKGALSATDVRAVTGIKERPLRQFSQNWQIARWLKSRNDQLFAFAHPLLSEVFAKKLGDDAATVLQKLVDYCQDWKDHCSPYALRHLAEHLKQEKRWDELFSLAHSSGFVDAQAAAFPRELSLPLKTIRIALEGAINVDSAPLMANFLLRHAHKLTATTEQTSPLAILRLGEVTHALELLELYASSNSYIFWALLLAWELKELGQEKHIQAILNRIQNRLRSVERYKASRSEISERWQGTFTAYSLAQIYEIAPIECIVLSQKLFGNASSIDWSMFYQALCQRGLLHEAFDLAKQQQSLPTLIQIAELQARQNTLEAEKAYQEIIELIRVWHVPFRSVFWVAKSIGNLLLQGYQNLANVVLRQLLHLSDTLQDLEQRSEVVLEIVDCLLADEMESPYLFIAFDLLQTIEVTTLSQPCLQIKILSETARYYGRTSSVTEAKTYFDRALAMIPTIVEPQEKQGYLIDLAYAQASVGFEIDARQTIIQMGSDIHRSNAVSQILSQQLERRDFEGALETVDLLYSNEAEKCNHLQRIAQAQAESGRIDDAIKIAKILPGGLERDYAWSSILKIQAQQRIQSKVHALDDIFEGIDRQISWHHEKVQVYLEIAEMQRVRGDAVAMMETLARFTHPEDRAVADQFLATAYAKAGDFEQALQVAQQIDSLALQIETLERIARWQTKLGKTNDSRSIYAQILKLSQRSDVSSLKAMTLLNIADVQIDAQHEQGTLTLHQAMKYAEKVADWFVRSQLLAFIGEKWIRAQHREIGKQMFAQAIELAERTIQAKPSQSLEDSWIFAIIAQCQARAGDLDAALATIEKFHRSDFRILSAKAEIFLSAATVHKKNGDFASQVKLQERIAEAYEAFQASPVLGFMNDPVEIFCNLAVAQSKVEDLTAARMTLAQLHTEVREESDRKNRVGNLAQIAIAYTRILDIDSASAMLAEIEDPTWQMQVIWAISYTQFKQNQPVITIEQSLRLAASICNAIENQQTEAWEILARVQALAGKHQQAIQTAERIPERQTSLLPALADIFVECKNLEALKQLIVPSSYSLKVAYELCHALAQVYPTQSSVISEIIQDV